MNFLVAEQEFSVRQACNAVGIARSAYYRPLTNWMERDGEATDALNAVIKENPGWGFWLCYAYLREEEKKPWNHKRLRRIYRRLGYNHMRRGKKRLPNRFLESLETPPIPDYVWAMDFMADRLYVGRSFRTLNILDEGVREGVHIEIDTSLSAERVVRVLEQLKAERPLPAAIRCDNGPEFTSQVFTQWCADHDIRVLFIQPGKPNQNAYVERFNRTYREELLNRYLFEDLDQVREMTHWWLINYNEKRPHGALGGLTPRAFRAQTAAEYST